MRAGFKKTLVTLALCLCTLGSTGVVAFGAWNPDEALTLEDYGKNSIDDNDIESYARNTNNSSKVWTSSNAKDLLKTIKKNDLGANAQNTTPITVDSETYYLDEAGLQRCRNKMVGIVQDYSLKADIDNMAVDFSLKADLDGAATALSGFEGIVSTIIGVLCYAVVIGMSLFTAVDLCYITMPVFRNKCDEMKHSGNKAVVKTENDGTAKFRWVTDEAVYAVETCAVGTGKSPLTVYVTKRIWAFMLLAVVIYIMFTGNIQLLANIAVNFIAGIMNVLRSLGG